MIGYNLQAILFSILLFGLVFFIKPSINQQKNSTSFTDKIDFTSLKNNDAASLSFSTNSSLSNLRVKSAVMKSLGEDYFFIAINTNQRWPIASLTKLMTAVIALEKFNTSQKISFNDKIVATEGTSGGFQKDESFTVIDLVKSLMTVSSNDAAVALAEVYGYQKFVDAMQTKAADLGMRQTTFFDPTGLSFLNQSTIIDLEKLVIYVYNNHPEIFAISREPSVKIGGLRILVNINEFAGSPNFIGGKTGYTDDANGNLISLFNDPIRGKPLLIIVLGTDDRFGETRKLLDFYKK